MIVAPATGARRFVALDDASENSVPVGDAAAPRPQEGALKRGFVTKRSVRAWGPFKNWRNRFLVLWPDKITWHKTEASVKEGELSLNREASVSVEGEGQVFKLILTVPSRTPSWFCASAGERQLELRCASRAHASAWERALRMTIAQLESDEGQATPACVDCEAQDEDRVCVICLGQSAEHVAPRCRHSASGADAAADVKPTATATAIGIADADHRPSAEAEGDQPAPTPEGRAPPPPPADAVRLLTLRRCRHELCSPCLRTHTAMQQELGSAVWCPVCRRPLHVRDVLDASAGPIKACMQEPEGGDDDAAAAAAMALPRVPTQRDQWLRERAERRAQRQFEATARRMHMKCCPRCRAPIIKDGGCNNMNCRACRHSFQWDVAPTVFPCRQVHLCKKGLPIWGTVCPGCDPIAKVKLVGVRSGVVILTAPLAALAAAGLVAYIVTTVATATVVAAVPLVALGPLAMLYHPVHAHLEAARIRQEEREDEERITTFKVARARRRWRFVAYLARETRGTMARAATDSEQIKVYWYACTSWRDGTYYFTIATPHPSFRPRHFATATPLGLSFDERRALTGVTRTQWTRPEGAATVVRWLELKPDGSHRLVTGNRNEKGPLELFSLRIPPAPSHPKPPSLWPQSPPVTRSREHRPNPVAVTATSGCRMVSRWRFISSIVPAARRQASPAPRGRARATGRPVFLPQ